MKTRNTIAEIYELGTTFYACSFRSKIYMKQEEENITEDVAEVKTASIMLNTESNLDDSSLYISNTKCSNFSTLETLEVVPHNNFNKSLSFKKNRKQ